MSANAMKMKKLYVESYGSPWRKKNRLSSVKNSTVPVSNANSNDETDSPSVFPDPVTLESARAFTGMFAREGAKCVTNLSMNWMRRRIQNPCTRLNGFNKYFRRQDSTTKLNRTNTIPRANKKGFFTRTIMERSIPAVKMKSANNAIPMA